MLPGFYKENFFLGESFKYVWAKRAQRDDIYNRSISYENALLSLSFGSSINLTSREKVSVHWGNQEKNDSQNLLWGKLERLGGGGGGGNFPPTG